MRKILFLLLLAGAIYGWWSLRGPIDHPPGVLIRDDPVQVMLNDGDSSIPVTERAGFTIRPLATFAIEGRVLHTCGYSYDPVSDLAPRDVALGWGRMSDSSVLARLKISQSNRFFFWRYTGEAPIPVEEITSHATNTHLIPATPEIRRQINWLRRGELIRIEGCLVEARKGTGPAWRSSLSREDDGNGACEIIWVSRLQKIKP